MKRVGILGGMYNPVHDGHLRAAIEARERLGLDEVRLVPCAAPPHRDAPQVPATLRAEMVAAAVADVDGLRLDARELELPSPSYTRQTLESLHAELRGSAFVLLLGEDAFRGFARWHEWQRVTELAHIVVMRRPGGDAAVPNEWPQALQPWLNDAEVAPDALFANGATGGNLAFCRIAALDISSTRIRELLAAGRDPRFLLPDSALDIIRRENLYQRRNKD